MLQLKREKEMNLKSSPQQTFTYMYDLCLRFFQLIRDKVTIV